MANKAISVELEAEQEAILQQQLASGRYDSVSAVMNDALRLMSERDAAADAWLRDEVAAVLADASPAIPLDHVFERLEARHRGRVKAAPHGTE
jgi:antitoxin ParD1/3/4